MYLAGNYCYRINAIASPGVLRMLACEFLLRVNGMQEGLELILIRLVRESNLNLTLGTAIFFLQSSVMVGKRYGERQTRWN